MRLSVIIPCFNEEAAVPLFYSEVKRLSPPSAELEFIFIDDGSRDKTLAVIKELASADGAVKYISFSRNFGKEAGILAGLRAAGGERVAVMDADLQDPPELLPDMLAILDGGAYDCVAARRGDRAGEPFFRSLLARAFYKLINRVSEVDIADGARDYRVFTRQVRDAVLRLDEYNRFSKGIFSWVGFKVKWLEYENRSRASGETKWSVKKLIFYALDGITAFSTLPLRLIAYFGILMACLSVFILIFIIARTALFGDPVAGWPSTVCIVVMLSGGQFVALGVIGEYIAKMFLEVKRRPSYIIKETNLTQEDL